jgi:hypothetical protein
VGLIPTGVSNRSDGENDKSCISKFSCKIMLPARNWFPAQPALARTHFRSQEAGMSLAKFLPNPLEHGKARFRVRPSITEKDRAKIRKFLQGRSLGIAWR